jgi:glutamate dehydrogenase
VANVQDVDEALLETVCSRLREHLDGDEAARAEAFARQYYRWVDPEDLAERSELDVYGAALAHFDLARRRRPGETKVRIYNPQFEVHGWRSPHTAVEIVTDDMPFLIDSVGMELNRRGFGVHLIIHPVLRVRRDEEGRLLEVLPHEARNDDAIAESVIHAEVARQTDPAELKALEDHLLRVIDEVHAAVDDWAAMRSRALDLVDELEASPPPSVEPDDVREARSFLAWLEDHNFIFLGYREYELRGGADELRLESLPESGLGILRQGDGERTSRRFDQLPQAVRARALDPHLLNLTKANSRATVHRPAYLDYIGVKRFDGDGRVVGERRFLGLYTHTAYQASPREIPILRRKVAAVLDRAGFPSDSHNHKALLETLESYPRDELFQISLDDLFRIGIGILHLGERQRLRLFVRRDTYGRFFSFLVFVPRDRFNTENRRRIESILRRAANASAIDYTTRVSESVLVRLHYLAYADPDVLPELDEPEVETMLVSATRSWADDLEEALLDEHGEERGGTLFRRYRSAFPPAYRADWVPRSALADLGQIEALSERDDLALQLYRPFEARQGTLRAKVFRAGAPLALSDMLPLFEDMGVEVADERPYQIAPRGREPVWIYDFGLTHAGDEDLQTDAVMEAFQDSFIRAWRGEAESDGYNRLVLRAGLTWRETAVIRSVGRYLRQAGTTFSDKYVEQALAAHPDVARLLVDLFLARFDPGGDRGSVERLVASIEEEIDAVESLDQDRILRNFLAVLQAMLRTNFFQEDIASQPAEPAARARRGKPYLSFKLDPSALTWLPLPRPRFEIFVYSPRTEGVHLRGGKVARGGIRWSDRREDFRTEVLGLMKAQMVKNAVIVPVGAKGGFVLKRPPSAEELPAEVEACYRTFIGGLLDLTDNIVDGEVVPPADVVRYDEDDPYLVVAADKGTAALSDVANDVARGYGFWLGDAFASGGSTGYDHKRMGITARGAWESVKRHFRELGHDVQAEDFTVVGIGDMSGDVFGNGMLLSRHIRLIGAFDHRHVFLDPDPDAAASFEERRRLFELERSSWADYDGDLISAGGGVYPRTAKSIPLSEEVRAALGVRDESLTPNDVIQALLRAPVDLLWNGGIGTFVKARAESHAEVGDRSSEAIRVDAEELRARVVGEGGNLGLTQLARIAYVRKGGHCYMDAIDNSAGVDCSDHEVNIKILLDTIVREGGLTEEQRNRLLVEMTDEVDRLVLRDNYLQTQALSIADAQSSSMIDVHQRYLRQLEQTGRLDRELEFLPDDETLGERKAAGGGLVAPEFAILLAYTKIGLYDDLLASDLPDDPAAVELERYFPHELSQRFPEWLGRHQLRREITASRVTNGLVNRAGTTFVFRLGEETGAHPADIARAFIVARAVFDLRSLWQDVEALDGKVPAQTQIQLMLRVRVLLERATRWLIRNRPRPLDIAAAVAQFRPGAELLAGRVAGLLAAPARAAAHESARAFETTGVPAELAQRIVHLDALFPVLDLVEIAERANVSLEEAAGVYFALGDRLELHVLHERIGALPRQERWEALARRALWEDLHGERRALTEDVLRTISADGVAGRVDAWLARNAAPVERTLQVLADVRAGGSFDLATLSVAVREIRNLIDATAP